MKKIAMLLLLTSNPLIAGGSEDGGPRISNQEIYLSGPGGDGSTIIMQKIEPNIFKLTGGEGGGGPRISNKEINLNRPDGDTGGGAGTGPRIIVINGEGGRGGGPAVDTLINYKNTKKLLSLHCLTLKNGVGGGSPRVFSEETNLDGPGGSGGGPFITHDLLSINGEGSSGGGPKETILVSMRNTRGDEGGGGPRISNKEIYLTGPGGTLGGGPSDSKSILISMGDRVGGGDGSSLAIINEEGTGSGGGPRSVNINGEGGNGGGPAEILSLECNLLNNEENLEEY